MSKVGYHSRPVIEVLKKIREENLNQSRTTSIDNIHACLSSKESLGSRPFSLSCWSSNSAPLSNPPPFPAKKNSMDFSAPYLWTNLHHGRVLETTYLILKAQVQSQETRMRFNVIAGRNEQTIRSRNIASHVLF